VLQTFDRDVRVTVTVPEKLEVHGQVHEWERDRIAEWGRPLEATAGISTALAFASARPAARMDLTWGPIRSELIVESVVDLTLDEATATARHTLKLPPAADPRQLTLRAGPGSPPATPRIIGGARISNRDGAWLLDLPATGNKEQIVVFSYVIPLTKRETVAGRRTVDLGLLWPEGTTRCETRLHLWGRDAATSFRPTLVDGPWEELPTEAVPDHPSLPALVLRGSGVDLPLKLSLTEITGIGPGSLAQTDLIGERVLIFVSVAESGRQDYTARFRFHRERAAAIEFELPAPPAAIGLHVLLGRKLLDQVQVLDESGSIGNASSGRIIRVPLQRLPDTTVELTLEYQLPPDPGAGRAAAGWSWAFAPPQVRGPVWVEDARWYVELPDDGVFLNWSAKATLQQKWGRRKFLPALRPASTLADIEAWFHAGSTGDDATDDFLPESNSPEGVAVARAVDLSPLRLTHAPRSGWVLACSLVVLAAGLALNGLRRIVWLFWLALAALPVLLGVIALRWPQPVTAGLVAGAPGAIVLGLVLLAQWLLRRRYHRRVVFMPGFTRIPAAESSKSRSPSSQQRLQPSTVDAPQQ
jgi:hypothetical protein